MNPENIPTANVGAQIVTICEQIHELGLTPKKFMHGFFTSKHPDLVFRCRLIRAGVGLSGTVDILRGFRDVLIGSPEGEAGWKEFILDEASSIVEGQNMRVGPYPQGAYVNSNSINEDFFSQEAEEHRERQVRSSMSFLHELIQRKLRVALDIPDIAAEGLENVVEVDTQDISSNTVSSDSTLLGSSADEGVIQSLDNLVYIPKRAAGLREHKLRAAEDVDFKAFEKAMGDAEGKPVDISMFIPTTEQLSHWKSVILAQLATALKTYAEHLPGGKTVKLANLQTQPPPIDPIEMYQPNIFFLRLMDAPDSSADGVSRVLEQVLAQIGVDAKSFAETLLVAEGDVGSNELVESLRRKRFPSGNQADSLRWLLTVFGPAHATWNMCKALNSVHWGDSTNGQDTGAWRTAESLGGSAKHPSQQDFNSLMMMTKKMHDASLVFALT
ncbi:uncharacterized protein MELLADRAFT_63088 [Melampsora larici-populina 98AG31]|uniref:DUF6589 domain-containing protein n=1 Tax=Melampsora larici-populina (strain 98AG31 / pathotype 3-4-7) TaxID=747676 RepID=F4RL91_MELLP|nr:uncharacterized protein MELLADRAFT_63088 [Melampsora larici-populina 98AG31]EGG06867.1 hypothetical protein MELLADRAFT_63088 [Melampsora larici-populina 98AG31]